MQPFGRNRYGPKIGGYAPLGRGAGSPPNTMWPGPRPTCMPSFILIRPTMGHNTPTSQTSRQTDRTGQRDRQRTDSIGRTVLQTVAQKHNTTAGMVMRYELNSVYTIQPVVKPVIKRFDNRLDSSLYPVYKHPTGCQTGCTTGMTTGWMFVYTIQTGY